MSLPPRAQLGPYEFDYCWSDEAPKYMRLVNPTIPLPWGRGPG
jgi:hypothetical protein